MISALTNTLISFFALVMLIIFYVWFINRSKQLNIKRRLVIIFSTLVVAILLHLFLLCFSPGNTFMSISFILLPPLLSFIFSRIAQVKKSQ
jgi:hypothetical protein